jgi:carboxyl-terminal processing protease
MRDHYSAGRPDSNGNSATRESRRQPEWLEKCGVSGETSRPISLPNGTGGCETLPESDGQPPTCNGESIAPNALNFPHPKSPMNRSPVPVTGLLALHRSLPSVVLALAGLASTACSTAQEEKTNFGAVAHAVVGLLQEYHYSGEDFEDRLSEKALNNYFDTLDYSRLYFTKPEIERFRAKYETELDDQVQVYYKLDPAHEIFTAYRKNVTARFAKIKALIESGKLDFDSNESVEITRKKSDWVATEAQLDELWRKEIIREVLLERINLVHAERRKKENEASGNNKTGDNGGKVQKKTPESPEQKVLKRHQRYLDTLKETDEEDVTNYFLSAVATAYDPHSEYLSKPEQDSFRIDMHKELIGIGAVLSSKDGAAEIKSLVPNGPADKNGTIKMGDLIVGVAQGEGEMEDIEGMKLQRIVEKIRGTAGTVVRLKVQPADDPTITREVTITRERVEMKDTLAKGELIEISNTSNTGESPKKVGWITLDSFYADMETRTGRSATADVKRILQRLEKEGISGLVIDLRGDGGGSLEEAIKLTGLFVKKGTPVVQQRDNRDRKEPRKTREHPIYHGPLVVMTDRASASASEIFAAALQDTGRAVVVGDSSTFGKGTVQTLLEVKEHMPPFTDKSRAGSLKVTIAKFYRIAGGSTQRKGVEPDVVLPSRYDAMDVGEEYLKDPLPFDTIERLPYDMAEPHPLPIQELNARSSLRTKSNPDFAFISEYIARTRDLIKKNTLSLNEKTRLAEDAANEERNRAYKEDRKRRVAEANKNGDPYRVYPVTLDNVDDPHLKLDTETKKDQRKSIQEMMEEDDDAVTDNEETFPHGLDPAKLETMHILQDLVALSGKAPPKDTVRRN